MVTERLAREDVREMHFDDRPVEQRQRVEQRHRGMGERGRVDDHAGMRRSRILDPGNQLALDIRLLEIDVELKGFRVRAAPYFDVRQCVGAVDSRFANAEHIQVRSVEDQDIGVVRQR